MTIAIRLILGFKLGGRARRNPRRTLRRTRSKRVFAAYEHLSANDMAALIAYLRSLPEVE
jgi:hypothetical protein